MDKQTSSSIKKRLILLAVILVFVVGGLSLTTYLSYKNISESLMNSTIDSVSELVTESASNLNARIGERCEMIEICADAIGKSTAGDDEKSKIFSYYSDSDIFDCVQFYGTDGSFISDKNVNPLMSKTEVMVAVKSAGAYAYFDTSANFDYNVYIGPVYDAAGEFTGAVVGAIHKENFSTMISSGALSRYGQTFICDENGEMVFLSSANDNGLAVGTDILANGVLDEQTQTYLKTVFAMKDKSGCLDATINGFDYSLVFSSVNVQGLVLITLVAPDYVTGKYNDIVGVNTVFIVSFSIILLAYMGLLLIQHFRLRSKLENISTENKVATETDSLTGYMSDKSFKEKSLQCLIDFSMNYAMISIDIDKFKTINEKFGYDGGNSIIKRLADIINRNLGTDDIFARDTGDLFYILCTYNNENDLSEKVRDIISDAEYQVTECKLSFSAGIYLIKNRNMSIRAICDRSNIARRSIKNNSTTYYAFFDNSMLDELKAEHEIESIMEEALEKREFLVYLQPKFNLHTDNLLVGAEALVRWQHGEKFITPGEFIPCFEKNGFVKKLDYYMFEEVCRLQRRWLSAGLTLNVISVNMSRVHLHDEDFVDTLVDICAKYSVPTCYFEIEITESAADENLDVLMNVFGRLRKNGFKISIDDFGTGYSSLNMLKDLPVDVLKIDREFLGKNSSESAKIIIAHVISLAMSLNIKTICEGIETEEQAHLLDELGCNMAQGFFFARPMPVEEYEKLAFRLNEVDAEAQKGIIH